MKGDGAVRFSIPGGGLGILRKRTRKRGAGGWLVRVAISGFERWDGVDEVTRLDGKVSMMLLQRIVDGGREMAACERLPLRTRAVEIFDHLSTFLFFYSLKRTRSLFSASGSSVLF